jgi:hypothetical protein
MEASGQGADIAFGVYSLVNTACAIVESVTIQIEQEASHV